MARPVLEQCVSDYQTVEGTEIQKLRSIVILLFRAETASGASPCICVIPHPGIEVPHDQHHVTLRGIAHTVLHGLVELP